MNTLTKHAVAIAATLTLANCAALAADMNDSTRPNNTTGSQYPSQREGTSYGSQSNPSTSSSTQVQDFNKASGFIGMDVQNQQGEHLGHIKDVVFDLNSQKISYAVMTTASKMMPIDEKLLAVPLNAFTVSSDQKHLILNADKSKVESAAGFDSKNWPNVSNPAWGAEPFWQQNSSATNTVAPRQNNLR